jgi:hypothetical protein
MKMETWKWRHGDMEIETWKHEAIDMEKEETWRNEDIEKYT